MTPITEFASGQEIKILALEGQERLIHRVESMGIFPGKTVQVVRVMGLAVVLKTGHTQIALRVGRAINVYAEAKAVKPVKVNTPRVTPLLQHDATL